MEASLRSYLSGRIPGVGPKRASLLAEQFGSDVISVLDSLDAAHQLAAVLPAHLAAEVKEKWDANPRNSKSSTSSRHCPAVRLSAPRILGMSLDTTRRSCKKATTLSSLQRRRSGLHTSLQW